MSSRLPIVDLACVLEAVSFSALRDYVLLSGSFVDNLHNCSSDIDLYILSEGCEQISSIYYEARVKRWVDIEVYNFDKVGKLSERVNINKTLPDAWGEHRVCSLDDLDLYYRLLTAIPLNSPRYPSLLWPVLDKAVLEREAAITHLIIARARWQDAAGALASGDDRQAAFVSEIGLWHALDAVAALLGDAKISSKWRLKKLDFLNCSHSWFGAAKELLIRSRRPFDAGPETTSLLGEVIFQITAKLATGRFSERIIPRDALTRIEVLVSGKRLEIDHTGLSSRKDSET
jgi:hypothetical protein